MKHYLLMLAVALLPLSAAAGTVCKTFEEAQKGETDDGIILFIYGPDWDRFSTDMMTKLINDPAVQAAAGDAKLILAPFYQRPDDKQKAEQAAAFGSLKLPDAMSNETYPALHFHDPKGNIYAFLRGPELLHGSAQQIAEAVKLRVENHRKQAELVKQAEAARGAESARLYGEASRIPGLERPSGVLQRIKAADPNDTDGYHRSLSFYPEGFAEEKKDLSLTEGLALVESKLAEPGYTPVQKQQFCAMAIGYLHRNKGEAADICKWAKRMKDYDPNSYLGHSADIVVAKWGGQEYGYQRGSYHNAATNDPLPPEDNKDGKKAKKKKKK